MRRGVAGVLGFVAGAIAGYFLVLFGWVFYTEVAGVHDFEGARTMGIAFFFAPLAGIVLGIAGAILVAKRLGPPPA